MSSHLEIWKPSGRELITTERPTSDRRPGLNQSRVAQARLDRLARTCRIGKPRVCLVGTGFGRRNGTYLNGEKISAERVLRSGDELRVGKSRLIFWEVKGDRRVRLANEAMVKSRDVVYDVVV